LYFNNPFLFCLYLIKFSSFLKMGAVCAGQILADDDAQKISESIDKKHKEEFKKSSRDIKILLLGTGEAGKSTIMKQMQIVYEDAFKEEACKDIKPIIYKQVIKNLKVLIRESSKTEYTASQTFDQERANRVNQVEERILDPTEFESQFTPQVWEDLQALWADQSIKDTYEFSYKFTLDDSTKYFLDRLNILAQPDYLPSNDDILRARVKTSAIVEKTFTKKINDNGYTFRIIDVGGQRSERRKWVHCFPDINALLFVVAISEYDQTLREDNTTKRLDESLKVYEETINNKIFANKVVILCLNKMDIFEEKLKQRNLKDYYPEYTGNTKEEAIEFIRKKFEARDKSKRNVVHTIATDTDVFKVVFDAIVSHVLHESLRTAGFIRIAS